MGILPLMSWINLWFFLANLQVPFFLRFDRFADFLLELTQARSRFPAVRFRFRANLAMLLYRRLRLAWAFELKLL